MKKRNQHHLSMELDKEVYKKLKIYSAKTGLTIAKIMRAWIEEMLKAKGGTNG